MALLFILNAWLIEGNIGYLLLTDTEERRRSLNAKRRFENLFGLDFIPIVNENDTIATSEIKYGDNDRLASRVAQITNADTLILLSDVDGLFTKNPKIFKDAKLIKKVENLNKDLINSEKILLPLFMLFLMLFDSYMFIFSITLFYIFMYKIFTQLDFKLN